MAKESVEIRITGVPERASELLGDVAAAVRVAWELTPPLKVLPMHVQASESGPAADGTRLLPLNIRADVTGTETLDHDLRLTITACVLTALVNLVEDAEVWPFEQVTVRLTDGDSMEFTCSGTSLRPQAQSQLPLLAQWLDRALELAEDIVMQTKEISIRILWVRGYSLLKRVREGV